MRTMCEICYSSMRMIIITGIFLPYSGNLSWWYNHHDHHHDLHHDHHHDRHHFHDHQDHHDQHDIDRRHLRGQELIGRVRGEATIGFNYRNIELCHRRHHRRHSCHHNRRHHRRHHCPHHRRHNHGQN